MWLIKLLWRPRKRVRPVQIDGLDVGDLERLIIVLTPVKHWSAGGTMLGHGCKTIFISQTSWLENYLQHEHFAPNR